MQHAAAQRTRVIETVKNPPSPKLARAGAPWEVDFSRTGCRSVEVSLIADEPNASQHYFLGLTKNAPALDRTGRFRSFALSRVTASQLTSYGRGAGVGRDRGVGAVRGVDVAVEVGVAVGVGVAIGVDVGVAATVAVGVGVGVGVGLGPIGTMAYA